MTITQNAPDRAPVLKPPAELFGNRRLPPLAELLPAKAPATAPVSSKPGPVDKVQIKHPARPAAAPSVPLLDKPAGKEIAAGLWYDTSRRSADGGVLRLITLDPGKVELVPIFHANSSPVAAREILSDKTLLGAINASFFGKMIIGDIKNDSREVRDDKYPYIDKLSDQRHFIAVKKDGGISTGRGGLNENGDFKHFIGGFPALYTRSQLTSLDKDIASGAFEKRSAYGGAMANDTISRSFVGIDAAGRVLLLAAGQGDQRSQGVSLAQGARLMRELGAIEAYVLDGGGSTSMYVRGVEHAPTDGRQVLSYLGLRSRQAQP